MKVQALILGDYGASSTFRLYRFPMPASPPLISSSSTSPPTLGIKQDHAAVYYYCLEDLERLSVLTPTSSFRHINTVQLYRDYPSAFCKNANNGYTYANTHVLYDLATRFKSSLLADLCQLNEHTPIDQQCSTLQRIPQLDIRKLLIHQQKQQSVPSLSSIGNNIHMHLVEQVLNPVRLDGQEWFLQPWIQQQQCQQQDQPLIIRLSPPQEEYQNNTDISNNAGSSDVSHSRTKQSSLLLQRRLVPKLGHHAPHLSINTPVYKDHHLHSIRSAPLRKSMSKHQINKRLQAAAAAAAATTSHSHHSTTPPSRFHQPMMTLSSSSSQQIPTPSTSHHHYYLPPSPTAPSSSVASTTKKQQFLHSFERLFDSLEHTRNQKTKLDDTIRQSSTLISKLQQQTAPKKVADKVAEQMEAWMAPYLAQMQHCVNRLEGLEEKLNARTSGAQQKLEPVPARSTITTSTSNDEDDISRKAELVDLMRRLDHLEKTLVDTTGQ